jgi:hypothetical protein
MPNQLLPVVIVTAFVGMAIVEGWVLFHFGLFAGEACLGFMFVGWFLAEVLSHQYILRYGRLIEMYPDQDLNRENSQNGDCAATPDEKQ